MKMKMKVKVVTRKLVKPCKATPLHLGRYKISLLDQINPAVNHTRILYYSCDDGESKCILLEESMAQILSNFYLLAGRYNKEKQQVDCNDQGALFSTAQVDVDLSLTLRSHVDPQQLNQLLPVDLAAVDGPTHPILAVQINRFLCGGLAIAACVSHRVVDTASFSLFFTAWATTAHTTGKLLIQPYFDHRSSYFPAENLPPHDDGPHENIITERYIFDNKAIKKLCQRLTSEPPLSRVVAVSTFLAQALLRTDIARRGEP
ncbi:pelargonidin 3-O-(6-caffeoylglucoside) 5-O-(6-O-malonylglucoside) 4'''-malonyltransferase-like [Salvia splendens]|uniref:pelargonidin 3-O-(6-caffeoylglucoside) 5-O-(6-O-malonylglucoside) 4'''-malonyltransferase-like n=1 Tax=Salvia splendens TaxID=180675 RepID=UPI001C27C787|nr:pelargonidin 3-O-(6-caffeoylglucoside) 5-O-(6-O-malonylglucoside) 4'''-malonyltransferase-like [Salvia splendens]